MPVLGGLEGVVGVADRLNLLDLAFAVERSVACVGHDQSLDHRIERRRRTAKKEVRDDTNRPHIDRLAVSRLLEDLRRLVSTANSARGNGANLGRHVARSSARRRQSAKRRLVDHLAEAKVGDEEVGILVLAPEQQVLRLEICSPARQLGLVPREGQRTSVNDSGSVEVRNGADDDLHELRCVALVVTSLRADPVEELSTLAEVGDEVHWM